MGKILEIKLTAILVLFCVSFSMNIFRSTTVDAQVLLLPSCDVNINPNPNYKAACDWVVNHTPFTQTFNYYYATSRNGSPTVTAQGRCKVEASSFDCFACLRNLNTALGYYCGNAVGGQVKNDVCFLRYEDGFAWTDYNLGNLREGIEAPQPVNWPS